MVDSHSTWGIRRLKYAVSFPIHPMKEPQFITRKELEIKCFEDNAIIYDTSTHAPTSHENHTVNLSELSPFIAYGNIPVPGQKRMCSDSVEGIWQGLKIIKGKTDFSYFRGKGRKRKGKPSGHLYGTKILGIIQARKKIYVPAFTFMWKHRIDPVLKTLLVQRALHDIPQYFLDVDTNPDINRPGSPYAHSSCIVDLIKQDIAQHLIR